jgi:N-acetylglucosamine-6-sulfatase
MCSFLLEPGTYDYLNTTWTYNNEDYQSFPGVNAIDITSRNALSMLDEAVNRGKPWFLTIAPAVPHVGINATSSGTFFPIPQAKWAGAFPDEIVPRTPNYNPEHQRSGASWILNMPRLNSSLVAAFDELYRARTRCVAGLDDLVGDLLAALDKYGILDNTHFIYTTDNGYHIGQHRLGIGKKAGFETDINIPMVWRGPGIPLGKTIKAVSTHTDLAPTFLSLFGLGLRTQFDGQVIQTAQYGASKKGVEHINIEHWGNANPFEVDPFHSIEIVGSSNNTYKGLRINTDNYSLYYSVWCTNEHELYDMEADEYQTSNLMSATYDITSLPTDQVAGWPMNKIVPRLDALMMVLKTCGGIECISPWLQLHPQGDVDTLEDAMSPRFDSFYAAQPKVSFSACMPGYMTEYEGPQSAMTYVG